MSDHRVLEQKRRIMGVVNAIGTFDRLIEDASEYRRGAFVFAHLLVPHEPFVLDAGCALREDRVLSPEYEFYYSPVSTKQGLRQWSDYLQQLECVHGRMLALVDALRDAGIYEESTIIVHSDHGSRIPLAARYGPNPEDPGVQRRVFLDFYSTFFALKRGDYALEWSPAEALREATPIANILSDLLGWPRDPASELLYRKETEHAKLPPHDLEERRSR